MSFIDCINTAIEAGSVKADKGQEAIEAYNQELQKLEAQGVYGLDAEISASDAAVKKITKQKADARRAKIANIQAAHNFHKHLDQQQETLNKLPEDSLEEYVGNQLDVRRQDVLGLFHQKADEVIERFRGNIIFRNPLKTSKDMKDVVRELFDEPTGNASAAEFVKIVREVNDYIINTARRAGADVSENPLWRMPQKMSVMKLNNNKQSWMDDHMGWIDWEVTRDKLTGDVIPPEKRAEFLEAAYTTQVSDGASKIRPGQPNGNSFGNFGMERVIYYKDSESWLAANESYGDGNLMQQWFAHMDRSARDIAVMQLMGTSPDSMRAYMGREVKRRAGEISGEAENSRVSSKASDKVSSFDSQFNNFMLRNVASADNPWVRTTQDLSNLQYAALLGTSTIPAIFGDFAKMIHRSQWNKTNAGRMLKNYLKLSASKKTRSMAIRSGLIAEDATNMAAGLARMTGELEGSRWSQLFANVGTRISGLSPHTQMAKFSFGLEMMGTFADSAKTKFDELPFKNMLEANGITKEDWDVFRRTPVHNEGRGDYLRPIDVLDAADVPEDTAQSVYYKFMGLTNRERMRSVLESSSRGKNFLTGDSLPSSFHGALLKELSKLKSFPSTLMFTALEELHEVSGGRGLVSAKGAGYAASMMLALTMGGAMALQSKEIIASGKDPQSINMNNPQFWMAAIMQGGGLGILGDFVFANTNSYGQTLSDTITGPSIRLYNDIRNLTVGNLAQLAKGEDTNFLKDLTSFGSRYAPFSKTWYLKLPLERMVMEQLRMDVDPKEFKRLKQREKKLLKDKGQRYWWRPGEDRPSRAPDIGKIIED